MEFDVPNGWLGLDSGGRLVLMDMTPLATNSLGRDRTATITFGRLPVPYDSKTHSEAIRKSVLARLGNASYEGTRSLQVAGEPCECAEFVQQGVQWLSTCNVQGEKITVVFAGAHGRFDDFYRWLSAMKSNHANVGQSAGPENPQ
jgi:hypothetical protein